MTMLFDMTIPLHDPGGKVHLALGAGITGDAVFSDCKRYRPLLTRNWSFGDEARSVLWIGMNPSVAAGHVDDPTVAREVGFTRRWGFNRYVKCNVSDYRATHPRDLIRFIDAGGDPWSSNNLSTILREAERADRIVMCHGAIHPFLRGIARAITSELRQAGHALWCLGLTKGGFPRHTLYLANDAALMRYEETPSCWV